MTSPLEDQVLSANELSGPRKWLSGFHAHSMSAVPVLAELAAIKQAAIGHENHLLANAVWCLEQIAEAHDRYLEALARCRERKFYAGWCSLEKAEIRIGWLLRHFSLQGRFGIQLLRGQVSKFQELYPYSAFFSPGMAILRQACSICGSEIKLREFCGHKRFELYRGEMCGRIIKEFRALEVSFVENPVQKFSVGFVVGGKPYNYALVDYVLRALQSPWEDFSWSIENRRRPASGMDVDKFRHLGRNDRCGCGSELKFKKCCLPKLTETYEHYQFRFKHPPPTLPNYEPRPFVGGVDDLNAEPSPPPKADEAKGEERLVNINILSTGTLMSRAYLLEDEAKK